MTMLSIRDAVKKFGICEKRLQLALTRGQLEFQNIKYDGDKLGLKGRSIRYFSEENLKKFLQKKPEHIPHIGPPMITVTEAMERYGFHERLIRENVARGRFKTEVRLAEYQVHGKKNRMMLHLFVSELEEFARNYRMKKAAIAERRQHMPQSRESGVDMKVKQA